VTGAKGTRVEFPLAVFEAAVIVRFVVALAEGVTVEGEKLQDAVAGSPEHAKVTG
jgi:hypothetical protein